MSKLKQASIKYDIPFSSLKLKGYIQPFERVLANAELYGVLDSNYSKKNSPFVESAQQLVNDIPSAMEIKLQSNLAYWESVTSNVTSPTKQVLLEAEIGANKALKKYHKSRKLRYGPHDLHEYRGKFFPQMVKSFINYSGIEKGSIVVDPMCGSGTTNLESVAIGMNTIGLDLNPLSVQISKAKCSVFQFRLSEFKDLCKKIISQTESLLSHQSRRNRFIENEDYEYLSSWFSSDALNEIDAILVIIDEIQVSGYQDVFSVALSNILREVSWQKMSDLRVRKEVYDYPKGKAFHLFMEEVNKLEMKLAPYLEHFEGAKTGDFEIREGDSRKVSDAFKEYFNKCDLLITSPPYANALPYLDTDRLSLTILGLLNRKKHRKREYQLIGNREVSEKQRVENWDRFQNEKRKLPQGVIDLVEHLGELYHGDDVGFRKRNLPSLLGKYYLDMLQAMSSAHSLMKKGSFGFYIVGNNSTNHNGERIDIHTDQFLWDIGALAGWTKEEVLSMELLPSRDVFRNNRGNSESILCFKA